MDEELGMSQPCVCPGLHPNRGSQQDKGWDSSLCFAPVRAHLEHCWSRAGVLAQEGPGPVGEGLEEATETITGLKHSLLQRQAGRTGVVQPGEGQALGSPCCSLPVLEGG